MTNINMFWFRHDNNSRGDLKISKLRHKFGRGAYEVFFMLLEIMHANGTGIIEYDVGALAYEMKEDEGYVQKIIEYCIEIGLIQRTGDGIFTDRMVVEIEERIAYLHKQKQKSRLGVKARRKQSGGQPAGQPAGQPTGQPTGDPAEQSRAKQRREEDVIVQSNTSDATNVLIVDKQTPEETARIFFVDESARSDVCQWLLDRGVPLDVSHLEIQKFLDYWTEPDKSGRKLRWENERYFDVKRRLARWFMNVNTKYSSGDPKRKAAFIS